jgi:hypothetical protein
MRRAVPLTGQYKCSYFTTGENVVFPSPKMVTHPCVEREREEIRKFRK